MGDAAGPTGLTTPAVAPMVAVAGAAMAPGVRLGDYEVLALAGAGGMGEVYRARDTRLDRDVALKVLRPGLDSATARERLLREAQAMARLSHPNVVTVYEVGTASELVFVSMEFVEGQTLRAWQSAAPRRRREILETYLHAGRGLSAVHRAGLVHGDFKPDNVMIDGDGRVRVSDFGLAGFSADPDAEPGVPFGLAATAPGSVGGTPAYMSPEQHRRAPIDARADQFAFCVALWEALCGQRPFAGANPIELRENVLAGKMRPGRAPRWLREVLRRGLAIEPEGRFESLDALLQRIAGGLALRRRLPVAAALVVAASGLVVAARAPRRAAPACAGAADHLAGVWDAPTRAAVERAFLASERPYAADTFARVAARLDERAGAWAAMRNEACEATAVRHEQSPALLDLRMGCLDLRLGELRALTTLFAAAPDPGVVDRAAAAVGKLDSLATCADAEALRQVVPLPADAAARGKIAAIYARAEEVLALRLGGKFQEALKRAGPLVVEAEALGFAPAHAAALQELAWIHASLRAVKDQEQVTYRLIEVASQAKDDARVARAWGALIAVVGYYEDRPDEALGLLPAARAALARAGDTDERRAHLLLMVGEVYLAKHDYVEAERNLAEAVALRERVSGRDEDDLAAAYNALGVARKEGGKLDAALDSFRKGVTLAERLQGPRHPSSAGRLMNIADVLALQGKLAEARAMLERVLAAWEPVYGPDGLDLGLVLTNLAHVDLELGHDADAEAEAGRAAAIKEKALGPAHRALYTSLDDLGRAQARLGKIDAAAATLERARAIAEKSPGPTSATYAHALDGLAVVAGLGGRAREALALERDALALYEKASGATPADLAPPLAHLGALQLELGATREAATTLARAVGLPRGAYPAEAAAAEFDLARAHAALHLGDARQLAEQARAGYAALGPARGARVAEIDRWLEAHR